MTTKIYTVIYNDTDTTSNFHKVFSCLTDAMNATQDDFWMMWQDDDDLSSVELEWKSIDGNTWKSKAVGDCGYTITELEVFVPSLVSDVITDSYFLHNAPSDILKVTSTSVVGIAIIELMQQTMMMVKALPDIDADKTFFVIDLAIDQCSIFLNA